MNAQFLVAIPNVSTACPTGTCNTGGGCLPCEADGLGVAPAPVPTLSEFGLIVLFCILAVIGVAGRPK